LLIKKGVKEGGDWKEGVIGKKGLRKGRIVKSVIYGRLIMIHRKNG
jgi:hypothetical protein